MKLTSRPIKSGKEKAMAELPGQAPAPEKKVYGAAAVMAQSKTRTGTYSLSKEKIAEKWNYIVEGGAGRGMWVLDTAKEFIHQANVPGVYLEDAVVSMGMFREKRPFVVVGLNALRDYRLFISARDYGINLEAVWKQNLYKRRP
jgi:hypothetical protein